MTSSTDDFTGAVHQNPYLAAGTREVHAVITVDARGNPETAAPTAAEVIIVDCSGSMGFPAEKIVKVKEAVRAAIDELRDGARFALIAGSAGGRMLWPAEPALAVADSRTRSQAKDALRRLDPGGGTTIGAWLRLAGQLLAEHPAAIRHAILLTDGRNQHESAEQLHAAVRDCAGLFRCDCRGVGTDWSMAELRMICSALGGTVDLVAEPADLAEHFRALMATSMRKSIAEVDLRLWTPVGATVRFVKQTAPTLLALSLPRTHVDPLTSDYPTASWCTESRDYHICIDVEPGGVGEEKLAGRVTFVQTGAHGSAQRLRQVFRHTEPDGSTNEFPDARIRAIWTEDLALSTVINDKVALVTGRAELAKAIQDGLAAHRATEADLAVDCLNRARKLAEEYDEDSVLARLDRIFDPDTGTFQLDQLSAREEMGLDIESTKTTPLSRG